MYAKEVRTNRNVNYTEVRSEGKRNVLIWELNASLYFSIVLENENARLSEVFFIENTRMENINRQ